MTLSVALVGAGRWGASIASSLARSSEFEFRAVCDPRPLASAVPRYAELGSLLAAEPVDAVVIATPPASHAALARRALGAGKHVLLEKPMCSSSAEAVELLQCVGRHGSRLMVGHLLIYHPAFRALRRLLLSEQPWRPVNIAARRWSLPGPAPARCPWWTLGPHDISLCCELLGRPHAVSVRRVSAGVWAELRFGDGSSANMSLSTAAARKLRCFEVETNNRHYIFDDLAAQRLVVRRDGETRPIVVSSEAALDEQLRHFARALQHGTPFESDLHAGWQVVEVLEAGQQSMGLGGEWVTMHDEVATGCG